MHEIIAVIYGGEGYQLLICDYQNQAKEVLAKYFVYRKTEEVVEW